MPDIVYCDNKDCCCYDDYRERCDAYRLVIEHGVCVGSTGHGRNVSKNDLDEQLKAENAKLRDLIHDLLRLPTAPAFDCFNCKYEEHDDCDYGRRCKLVERARDLGIRGEEDGV